MFGAGRRSGFTTLEQLQLDRIVPTLRTVCELRLLRLTEAVLLDSYFGSATGHRILVGHIKRNDVEVLETALLLCDLRDFTSLSNRLPSARVLQLLNAYFDRVIPAIVDGGGEILKFMGDAVLAFFHCSTPSASCAAALEAAQRALDRLNCFTSPVPSCALG